MKKAFKISIAAALALVLAGVVVVSLSLGKIVKSAVEAAGPRLLGAPVTLGLVTISPLSGEGTLRDLVIGNPPGFKCPQAIKVGSVEVAVKLSSLLTDTIVVRRVAVRGPELIWEIGPGGSNLTKLQSNAQASVSRYGGEGSQGTRSMADPAKKGKSLLIEDFSVTGGQVGLAATALGGQGLNAPLPEVHLTDLGGKDRSPAEVAAQAFRAITNSAQGAVGNIGGKAIDAAKGAAAAALGSFFKKGREMTAPDFLPLEPGLRLEYEVRRAGEVRTLVVEQSAAEGGASVRRTWTAPDGSTEMETSRVEKRADGVYIDGERALPFPARPGASWSRPPRSYRIDALDASVETPAGKFTGCLSVRYLIAGGDGGAGERLYAPGVGLARELCSDEADPFEVVLTAVSRRPAEAAR